MKIINGQIKDIEQLIERVDQSLIMGLVQQAFECRKNTERYILRDKLYKSIYKPQGLESKEKDLEQYLQQLSNANIKTENQNKEYKWIKINKEKIGTISHRFYIAPNPENMHEIVKRLTESFVKRNVPVKFKYQLTTGIKHCDRIIIYSDFSNKDLIEDSINEVYNSKPSLFNGCERNAIWLYETKVPSVYLAPETPNEAYSNKMAEAIIEAKEIFNFFYGITNTNNKITLNGEEKDKAIELMEMLICSIMLRKGILLSKDGRIINLKDKNIKIYYNYDTGVLNQSNTDERGYFEAQFEQSPEGKKALFENFYSVSKTKQQPGVQIKFLTLDERHAEVDRLLYPHKYQNLPSESPKTI